MQYRYRVTQAAGIGDVDVDRQQAQLSRADGEATRNGACSFFAVFTSEDEPQPVQSASVLGSAGDDIDAGSVNAAVAQNIRQLCDIFVR